ncbi:hypothetical protein Bpfe_016531, partial [Biomphalaria pfeifferi]
MQSIWSYRHCVGCLLFFFSPVSGNRELTFSVNTGIDQVVMSFSNIISLRRKKKVAAV